VPVVKKDGSEVRGKLTLIETPTVSNIKVNGEAVTVRKRDARSVKADVMRGVRTGSPDPGWARGAAVFGYAAANGGRDVAVLPLLKPRRRENSTRSDLEVGLRCRFSF
jgi:hypothetical protein